MKVSLIIPIYNVSRYVERCILSAFSQTYQDIEYVLIDDATPDDSMQKVKQIVATKPDKKVRIVSHLSNRGLSAARNTGVKNSTGDYIYFLDSDDEITAQCIETLISYAKGELLPDVIMGEMMTIGADRKKYPQLNLAEGTVLFDKQILHSFLKRNWYEMACNKLVKRNLFFERDCWFCEGILHEDTLWSFKLSTQSQSLVVCKNITYNYYIHSNSITQKRSIRNIDSMLFVIEQIIKIKNEVDFPINKSTFNQYVQNLRIYMLKCMIISKFPKLYSRDMEKRLKQLFEGNRIEFSSYEVYLKCLLLSAFIKYS